MRITTFLITAAIMALLPLGVAAEEVFNYTYLDMTYLDNGMDGTVTATEGRDQVTVNVGEGDGTGLRMSLALTSNVHVFAGYAGSNLDANATHTVSMPTIDEMKSAFLAQPGDANWDGLCDLTGDGKVDLHDLSALAHADTDGSYAELAGDMTDWKVGIGYNAMITRNIGGYAQLFWDNRDVDLGSAPFMGKTRAFGANDNGVGVALGLRGKVTDRLQLTGHATYSPVGEVNMLAATSGDMLSGDTLVGIGGEYWITDALSFVTEIEGDGDVRSWLVALRYQMRS